MHLGMHCSTAGGLHKAVERCVSCGGEIMQIFVKNNMQWFGKPYAADDCARFAAARQAAKLELVFGHTGYLINLAAPASPNRDRSIQSLLQEVQLADSLDLPFLVFHPGAHLGSGEEKGIRRVAEGLDHVFRETRKSSVRIALENTAGQGTCLGYKIAHLAAIYDQVDQPRRLAVCLDTAHFFAAGYDLRRPQGWEAAMAEVESLVGLDQVVAFHLNDSKGDLGSRLDRHAGIGQGRLGREAFRHIVNDIRFAALPGCLETPKSEDMHEDIENLAVLRGLVKKPRPSKRTSRCA
jgi:deoxyribonuclease-4